MSPLDEKMKKLKKLEVHLSNERTLLSYLRTAASILVLGVALFKFFESKLVITLGWACVVVGALVTILGIYRYFQERGRIKNDELDHTE